MNNPRLTKKEQGLLKGAFRRVFSRSDLRKEVLDFHSVEYHDPKRPRVKRWSWCNECGEVVPSYTLAVDHIQPVVPLTSSLENMSADDLLNAVWCARVNLQGLCQDCHKQKSKAEMKLRRENKKRAKNG